MNPAGYTPAREEARVGALVAADPFHTADVVYLEETGQDLVEAKELARALDGQVQALVGDAGGALAQLELDEDEPGIFADRVAAVLDLPTEQEVELLAQLDVPSRIRLLAY